MGKHILMYSVLVFGSYNNEQINGQCIYTRNAKDPYQETL